MPLPEKTVQHLSHMIWKEVSDKPECEGFTGVTILMTDGEPNWIIGRIWNASEECEAAIRKIVETMQKQYRVKVSN